MVKSSTGNNSAVFPEKYGKRDGQKQGGIHKADPDGGIYKVRDTNDPSKNATYLIKRDTEKPQNDIAEYLGAKIFSTTAPGTGAEIELEKNQSLTPNNSQNKNPFLASKYFSNFQDFFRAAGKTKRPEKLEALQSKLPEKLRYVTSELAKKVNGKYKYENYAQATVTSLLIGDFSVHSGNIGVVDNKKIVRIDFGAAFRDFTSEINPTQSIKNRVGLEKNYFLRDHPKARIVSPEFSAELRRVADIDLKPTIKEAWGKITSNFDKAAITKFGLQIGAHSSDPAMIESHLEGRMQERQQSMRKFAGEIDIEIALKTKGLGRQEAIAETVMKVEKESPGHLSAILNDPTKAQLGTKYSKEDIKLLRSTLAGAKKAIEAGKEVEKLVKSSPAPAIPKIQVTMKNYNDVINEYVSKGQGTLKHRDTTTAETNKISPPPSTPTPKGLTRSKSMPNLRNNGKKGGR